jgi:CubicO group peptidase (beta-lactamase class C family)
MKTRLFFAALAIGTLIVPGKGVAQDFPYRVFERYLEPLAQQIGLPGLSAVIVQNNRIAWSRGYGYADVENQIAATEHTPYAVGGITQALAGVLIGVCVDRHTLDVDHGIRQYVPNFPTDVTIRHVLAHASEGRFRYDASLFAALTTVVEKCSDRPYRVATAAELITRLNMTRSVPGLDLREPGAADARALFDDSLVDRYLRVLREVAVPYRIDRRRNTRSEYPRYGFDAAGGLVSTAIDLAEFERQLDDQENGDNIPISFSTLDKMWTQTVLSTPDGNRQVTPTGLGWFVQTTSGVRLVWTFGHIPNAGSALIVKMPHKRLTLIMLSNSGGLAAGFNFEQGDVTTSPFVKVFLALFI